MSNLFKKVRIVHSPLQERYFVEQKSVFSLWWTHVGTYDYVRVRSTSITGCSDLAEDAFARAQKKAEQLLARTVVWEKSNFVWYP